MFSKDLKYKLTAMIDVYNENHSDAIDLILREHLGILSATGSKIAFIDEDGIHLSPKDGRSDPKSILKFLEGPKSPEDVVSVLMEALSDARSKAPLATPKTKIERDIEKTRKLRTYITQVTGKRKISSNIVELTFTGGFTDFPNLGNDAFLYLIVNHVDHTCSFPEGFSMETFRKTHTKGRKSDYSGAYYTIRDCRPNEIDVWFVLHDDSGPLSRWAEDVLIGGEIAIWGPRSSFRPPAETNKYLFIADETAQPAVLSSIEGLARQKAYSCLFETQDASSSFDLGDKKDRVDWIYRGDEKAGQGTGLIKNIESLRLDTKNLYIFGAGETRQISAIRRYLLNKYALASSQITMVGYWSRSRE